MTFRGNVLAQRVRAAFAERLQIRDGRVVPTPDDVTLSGGLVKLDATMLYADLADSTSIVAYDATIASRIFKAFLICSSLLIRFRGGHVRSFDGDRVMGVFLRDDRRSAAATCALNIHWAVDQLINPMFHQRYGPVFDIAHCTGIDASDVSVVRAGIVGSNDLIWVGRAANVAAKLSSLRISPYRTIITPTVYFGLAPLHLAPTMWDPTTWTHGDVTDRIFASSWALEP